MSHYLNHYWALYRQFMEVFKNLKYCDIPIAIMVNFYQLIDEELKLTMEDESFLLACNGSELNQNEIQPYFETWLEKIKLPAIDRNMRGKILINYDYTRIPEETYQTLFNPDETMILTRSSKLQLHGIPTEFVKKYEETDDAIANKLTKNATHVFSKWQGHPAFENEFFQQTFLNRIPTIIKAIRTAFNLLDSVPISTIVVGTTEDMLSRALAVVGAMKGIHSLCLQHGILMGEEAFMPVFSTVIGVYGEYEKEWYMARGMKEERIAEIGHPKYDPIFTAFQINREKFLSEFSLDPNKHTLLVITGPNIQADRFEQLIGDLLENQDYQLIIKPHPWEIGKGKYSQYLELMEKYESIRVYTSRDNRLYELLSQVDGVLTTLSTVALEALLMNKPVFIYDFLVSNRPYQYYRQLGEFLQEDPAKLTKVIKDYFSSDEMKERYNQIRKEYVSTLYINGTSGEKLLNSIQKNL
ncbi:capsular polysaccharide export protein, LipB/KpsS family [Bacillus sp. JJ1764]|uniref:capsular polysaccharide export protein, LipB/KpsS family n=1 Tax=Bacillus sp. JJ1764 TaxID=3122964 RepID=UPI0030001C79